MHLISEIWWYISVHQSVCLFFCPSFIYRRGCPLTYRSLSLTPLYDIFAYTAKSSLSISVFIKIGFVSLHPLVMTDVNAHCKAVLPNHFRLCGHIDGSLLHNKESIDGHHRMWWCIKNPCRVYWKYDVDKSSAHQLWLWDINNNTSVDGYKKIQPYICSYVYTCIHTHMHIQVYVCMLINSYGTVITGAIFSPLVSQYKTIVLIDFANLLGQLFSFDATLEEEINIVSLTHCVLVQWGLSHCQHWSR